MKSLKSLLFLALPFVALSGCTKEDAYEIPPFKQTILVEDFSENTDGTVLNTTNWTNVSQQGTKKWTEEVFSGNGYAELSTFTAPNIQHISWLISPEINMDTYDNEKLFFQTAQSNLTTKDNTLELMVSKDFDGTNFAASSWIKVNANIVNPDVTRFAWVNSGEVDFSKFTGKIHFAFKGTILGTSTSTRSFQLDNVRLYNTSK